MNSFQLNIHTDGNRSKYTIPPYLQDKFKGPCVLQVIDARLDAPDIENFVLAVKSSAIFQPNSYDNILDTNSNTLCYLCAEIGNFSKKLSYPSSKLFINNLPNEFDIYLQVIGDVDRPPQVPIGTVLNNLQGSRLSLIITVEVLEKSNCGCE